MRKACLGVLLMVLLAGGIGQTMVSSTASPREELRVLVPDFFAERWVQCTEAFGMEYGVDVGVVVMPTEELFQRIIVEVTADIPPDLVMVREERIPELAEMGFLADLTGYGDLIPDPFWYEDSIVGKVLPWARDWVVAFLQTADKGKIELAITLLNHPCLELPPAVVLGAEDEGSTVKVGMGDLVEIRLEANPSTGYSWALVQMDERFLDLIETEFKPDSSLLGAPGVMTFRFRVKALKCGLTEPEFVYARPWEVEAKWGPPPLEETYSITLEVGPPRDNPGNAATDSSEPQLPPAFDWRMLGGVPPVKDQDGCGSCWAFGTMGPLESNIAIHDGITEDLSEQYLVSCNTDSWGCGGGWWAHDYHEWNSNPCDPNPGAVPEADSPYTAVDDPCCGACPCGHPYMIMSWHCIGTGATKPDCCTGEVLPTDDLKRAIYYYGPISVAVCVGPAFQWYTAKCDGDGVLEPPKEVFHIDESKFCWWNVNHAVVLVGWDDNVGEDGAWILRNSWGKGWGEAGYMYIGYGISNVGSCANYVIYPEGRAECCEKEGLIPLKFGDLPFPTGPLPLPFVFEDVVFIRLWGTIEKHDGSLFCYGSEESPLGVWHDAAVELAFGKLPCQVCKIVAKVDGHGPEARLVGDLLKGGTQTAVCPGDRRVLTLATTPDNPFISVTLSGQEAEWFYVLLE